MMRSLRLLSCSIVTAALGLWLNSLSADDAAEAAAPLQTSVRRALVFAPGKYAKLKPAPYHFEGATLLQQRLTKAGFADEHVMLLSAAGMTANRQATAANFLKQLALLRDDAGADDVILVVVASFLRTVNGTTYICTSDSDPAELAALKTDTSPGSFVSMSQVVECLEGSAATHRLLVVDAAEAKGETSGPASSTAMIPLPPGLWSITSTSPNLCHIAGSGKHTWFTRSLLDGMTEHADSDSSGGISLFELTDYLQRYAELIKYELPNVQGKTNVDFELATLSSNPGDTETLRPELRKQVIERFVESAKYELFRKNNPASALRALRRALSYHPAPETKMTIENLSNTALAAAGDVLDACKRAAVASQLLQFRTTETLTITVPHKIVGRQVPAGIYLTIDGFSDDGKWLWVAGALQARFADGGVIFTEYPIERGWLDVKKVASSPPPNAAVGKR